MAIINIILRKMINNRWLVGSLFLGLLITASLVSSIPTYSSSVLNKLLLKELEDYQVKTEKFPGEFSYLIQLPEEKQKQAFELNNFEKINSELTNETDLPIEAKVRILSTIPLAITHRDSTKQSSPESQNYASIRSFSDIEKHIVITDGKVPSATPVKGIHEVLVTEGALEKREMVLNTVLVASKGEEQILIKPVGTFKAKNERDSYWFTSPDSYNGDFIILEEMFRKTFLGESKHLLENARFYTAFDYHSIEENNLVKVLALERKTRASVSEIVDEKILVTFPAKKILSQYEEKSSQLRMTLWSLNVPLFIMLGIYLSMVTKLIIDRQRNEISVLSSRGAKRSQILTIYLIEITILGLFACLIGPFLGLLLCKMLGATNGFLEFVQRSSLMSTLLQESFLYALGAIVVCIVMMMFPIYQASNQSIVHQKRNTMRVVGNVSWYTIFIEISLLSISFYGWTVFNRRKGELLTMEGEAAFSVDPLLFFVPATFIIGLGLLALRFYPMLLKVLYKLGNKYFSLSFYSTLVQVSRASKQYVYLMLFLIMTIAVGVFSASAARTINNNLEEQIRYENGSDLALEVRWESQSSGGASPPSPPTGTPEVEKSEEEEVREFTKEVIYTEPSFEPFLQLKSVEHVTKVFKKEEINIEAKGESISSVEMMGIEPKEFGQTAWFKTSLLPHHWFEYLNLLAVEPSAVLITESVASALGVKEGDYLTLSWSSSDPVEFVVYGIIKYWPGFNPLQVEDSEAEVVPSLVVANLSYVQNMMGLEPYEVWLKVKEGTPRTTLYDEMKETGIPLTQLSDVQPQLTELKNGAFLLGINGTLSLGFLISVVITFIGFLIYWILTMKSRSLQYGIYRAMGIPLHQLIGILVYEQLLTSGVACVIGIAIGGLTSSLFVPMFQLSFNPKNIVPPFQVIFDARDEVTIYLFVISTLLIGLLILGVLLKNIRVHQAIKLGED
ncbi:ABC transporter permease [Fredinandcohnia humi]